MILVSEHSIEIIYCSTNHIKNVSTFPKKMVMIVQIESLTLNLHREGVSRSRY